MRLGSVALSAGLGVHGLRSILLLVPPVITPFIASSPVVASPFRLTILTAPIIPPLILAIIVPIGVVVPPSASLAPAPAASFVSPLTSLIIPPLTSLVISPLTSFVIPLLASPSLAPPIISPTIPPSLIVFIFLVLILLVPPRPPVVVVSPAFPPVFVHILRAPVVEFSALSGGPGRGEFEVLIALDFFPFFQGLLQGPLLHLRRVDGGLVPLVVLVQAVARKRNFDCSAVLSELALRQILVDRDLVADHLVVEDLVDLVEFGDVALHDFGHHHGGGNRGSQPPQHHYVAVVLQEG